MFASMVTVLALALALFGSAPSSHHVQADVQKFTFPIVHKDILGYSTESREITRYTFGNGNQCLLFFGGIHGNERGTVILMRQLVEYLHTHPEVIPANKKVVIIPLLNPDGYFTRADKLNAQGVNLNRNFPTDDWIKQEGGEETFAGEQPFSEIESRLFQVAVHDCDPELLVAYHSQGSLVSPEADSGSIELAHWYAEQTGYTYFDDWNYAGTATRWFSENYHKPAITLELTSHMRSDWGINKQAILHLIAR